MNNALSVGAKVAMLETIRKIDIPIEDDKKETVNFLEAAGGASIDIAKFAPAVGPSLVIGGSYGMYNAEHGKSVSESTLLSAELNYQFHRRFSLLLGYQQLDMCVAKNYDGKEIPGTEHVFTNFATGIQYRVADGGVLTAKFNRVSGERTEYKDPANDEKVGRLTYKAVQPELFLTVTF